MSKNERETNRTFLGTKLFSRIHCRIFSCSDLLRLGCRSSGGKVDFPYAHTQPLQLGTLRFFPLPLRLGHTSGCHVWDLGGKRGGRGGWRFGYDLRSLFSFLRLDPLTVYFFLLHALLFLLCLPRRFLERDAGRDFGRSETFLRTELTGSEPTELGRSELAARASGCGSP